MSVSQDKADHWKRCGTSLAVVRFFLLRFDVWESPTQSIQSFVLVVKHVSAIVVALRIWKSTRNLMVPLVLITIMTGIACAVCISTMVTVCSYVWTCFSNTSWGCTVQPLGHWLCFRVKMDASFCRLGLAANASRHIHTLLQDSHKAPL